MEFFRDAFSFVLHGLSEVLIRLAQICYGIADTTANVLILGEWLHDWFDDLGDGFLDQGQFFALLADHTIDFLDFLELELDQLIDIEILRRLIQQLKDFFEDPANWIAGWLSDEFPWLEILFSDPISWLEDLLDQILPGLRDLLSDPVGWVRELVIEILGEIGNLFDDPLGWLLDLLDQLIPWLADFLDDPLGFILSVIRDFSHELFAFITEPLAQLTDWLSNLIEDFETLVQDAALWVGRLFIRFIDDYLDDLADWLADKFRQVVIYLWGY